MDVARGAFDSQAEGYRHPSGRSLRRRRWRVKHNAKWLRKRLEQGMVRRHEFGEENS